jgi:hypothetical protein
MISHCLENLFRDGDKIVSLTHRSRSTPQKHYISSSGAYFCQSLNKPHGVVRHEELGKLKNPFISSGLKSAMFRLVA